MGNPLPEPVSSPIEQQTEFAQGSEFGLLRDILRQLPAGVTVQDEDGRFLLINDAAAAQLGLASGQGDDLAARHLNERRAAGLELLRDGRATVAEMPGAGSNGAQVLLASHRPVTVAGRNLLLSCSADISEQKAVEDHLFRSAFFDGLTGFPMRRGIENPVENMIPGSWPGNAFRL